ncbi:NF-kappa-B essential modulator-like isoform X2 [Toxorhynchites rutilus septentrionalis]|uniref:NF-kappa-B essential modulator-like isoform X2 n=1 Tax=Toxorhynchites rutilus septentrionalis TaxID=329112 RepID=UPI00247A9E10|nr:NF-kappa-B essential modulator-like isoform X2 [Toxorhynchites rutilus septentrionalis]
MSDDLCSFIVLGSSPTPSMEQYDYNNGSVWQVKGKESSSQNNSGDFSLLQVDGSPKSPDPASAPDIKSSGPVSIDRPSGPASNDNHLAASVIMGSVQTSLLQTFPSLMHSSMPVDEVKALQQLVTEHGQMKQSIQKANVAMRKNFSVIQEWQDDVKKKYCEQASTIDEQRASIENVEADNKKLAQAVACAENRANELEKEKKEEISSLQRQLEDVQKQAEAERTAAAVELNELKQMLSEKHSILQNLAKEIERLELEKQEFVVVKSNKPEDKANSIDFVTKEEHDRQIKALQRQLSIAVATNLEFKDMKQVYVDEINCIKANLSAAEGLLAKNRTEMHRMAKDIETKDVSLAENIRELKSLSEQVDVLTAQLDIYKNDFEAERTARAQLASEKDRALSDLKLLQKRNQQLIEEVQNGSAEEEAKRAANESLDKRESPASAATNSGGGPSAATSNDEQSYERHVLYCPLCNSGFKDLSTLQNHVEDCVGVE